METLQHGNLRYEILYTRFQGIKPLNSKNLLLNTLYYISRGDAPLGPFISPVSQAEYSKLAAAVNAYEQECRRVALFYRSQHHQLWDSLLEVVGLLRCKVDFLLNPTAEALHGYEKLITIRALLDSLGEKAVALENFAKLNVDAAAELALMVDRKKTITLPTTSSAALSTEKMVEMSRNDYYTAAEAAMLGMLRLDPIILGLSDAYALLQFIESKKKGAQDLSTAAAASSKSSSLSSFSRWVAPQKFKRTTRKFWLKLSDVALFKTEVIKHLPILVYGNRRKITEIDPSDLPFTSAPAESDSSPVSSVYLDSLPAGLPSYHSRLRREDRATAVRLRWYGERNPEDPFQQIFVEKKIHVVGGAANEPTTTMISSGDDDDDGNENNSKRRNEGQSESEKQRISLPQSQIPALLSGHSVAVPQNHSKDDFEFLQAVQLYILEDSHAPVLRTCYNRTAFQCDDHNRVRISMDTNLRIVQDYNPNNVTSSGNGVSTASPAPSLLQWCRTDADIATATPHVYFPYAVIEVKLQVNPPEWLQNLVRQKILLPVPKFSKFLHGTAMLYQPYVENVPHWFLPNSNYNSSSISNNGNNELPMTPATWEEMIEPSAEAVSDAAAWLFPTLPGTSTDCSRESDRKESKVTQVKPGLLWGWRKGGGGRASASGSDAATTTAVIPPLLPGPITVATTSNTTATASDRSGTINEDKHSAPGTPDGASPRADLLPPPVNSSSIENKMMLHELINTDTSTGCSNNGSSGGQRVGQHGLSSCPSATSSTSVSSLISSTENNTNSGASLTGVDQHQQLNQLQSSPSTWHVFQYPALSPLAFPMGDTKLPMDLQLRNGNGNEEEDDLESGAAGETATASGGAVARTTTTTKPASRKSSLVHLVSSIPGLASIATNTRGNNNNSSTVVLAAKTPPPPPPAVVTLEDELKKEPPILPPFSIISSPSSSLPGGNRNDPSSYPSGTNPPRAMVRTRVEPKTFFANERTFLQWLQISVLVMFLGLNLLNGSMLLPGGSSSSSSSSGACASTDSKCIASKISGALIAPVALLFMGYSLFMYRQRTRQILRRESVRYDDQRGPAILVAILLSVMLISYVIAMIYVF